MNHCLALGRELISLHHWLSNQCVYAVSADEPPWDAVNDLLDESWFVDTDMDAALERVVQRQVGWCRTCCRLYMYRCISFLNRLPALMHDLPRRLLRTGHAEALS